MANIGGGALCVSKAFLSRLGAKPASDELLLRFVLIRLGRAERATVTRYNAQVGKQLQRKPDIVAGFSFFRWPCLKRTRITEVAFRASWQCKVCFFPCRTDKHAREHLKFGCPHLPGTKHPMPLHVHLKHAKQRLSKLEQVRELFENSRCSAEAKARGLTFFAGAKTVLERPLEFHGSPCF